ncbi:MAG: CAP domain-containing protein, partial [Terracoccus sp.]
VAVVAFVAALLACSSPAARVRVLTSATPPYIPAAAGWLQSVNYFRAMSGLAPVTDDSTLAQGATNHSCYMLVNDMAHASRPGSPGYTPEGNQAGTNGNVAVSSVINTSERAFVELWMTGPFHAIGILRPGLTTASFGICDSPDTSKWHSAATLDVLDGLIPQPAPTQPILFPGNGTTTNLNRFLVETPNPLTACGWTGEAGLPVLAMMPEATIGATATISGPNGPLASCTVSAANTTGTSNQILDHDNVVVVIPRLPLSDGTYQVTIHTDARDVRWTFNIDQAAAGTPPPRRWVAPRRSQSPFVAGSIDDEMRPGAGRLSARSPSAC